MSAATLAILAPRRRSPVPGFGLTLGVTLVWVGLIVLLPLAALTLRPWELGFTGVWRSLTEPRVAASLRLSFGTAALAALVDAPLGLLIAWVMVRYRFPGRRLADAMIDLPLALPTAVAGIALTALFAPNGWVGAFFHRFGIEIAYTPAGIALALMFVGLPFVVRTVEPVVMDLPMDAEEAAATLGATRLQAFRAVILPALAPALAHGLRGRAGPRRGRVRIGHLHRGQHADADGDRAAADRDPARTVQLRRGRGPRARDAADLLRHFAAAQCGAAAASPAAGVKGALG